MEMSSNTKHFHCFLGALLLVVCVLLVSNHPFSFGLPFAWSKENRVCSSGVQCNTNRTSVGKITTKNNDSVVEYNTNRSSVGKITTKNSDSVVNDNTNKNSVGKITTNKDSVVERHSGAGTQTAANENHVQLNGEKSTVSLLDLVYNRGHWEFEKINDGNGKHECCSWDFNGRNSDSCLEKEMKRSFRHAVPPNMIMAGGHICECASKNRTDNDVFGQFVWKFNDPVEDKAFRRFNASDFCQIFKERGLWLIGDSTTMQFAATLANAISHEGEDCGAKLQYHPSDFLVKWDLKREGMEGLAERYSRIQRYLMAYKPNNTVIVIATSHHYRDMDHYSKGIDRILELIKQYENPSQNNTWIFKSNNGVQGNCANYFEPSTMVNILGDYPVKYHYWAEFLKRDKIAKDKFKGTEVSFLDLSALYLRPEGHSRDCGHVCVHEKKGTPLSYAVRSFYNLVKDLTSRIET